MTKQPNTEFGASARGLLLSTPSLATGVKEATLG